MLNHQRAKMVLLFSGFMVSILWTNCIGPSHQKSVTLGKSFETVIGNPLQTSSFKISNSLCETIKRCRPDFKMEDCERQMLNTSGANATLSLTSQYMSLAQAQSGEMNGKLIANAQGLDSCSQTLESISCDDPRLTLAYQTSRQDPLVFATSLLSAMSCSRVFFDSEVSSCPVPNQVDFQVNDLSDLDDQKPGDGLCSTTQSKCTLRAALREAAADKSQTRNIQMLAGTINVRQPLMISSSVKIYGDCGSKTIIDGQSRSAIFIYSADHLSVEIHSVQLQNALSSESGAALASGYKNYASFIGSHLKFYKNKTTSENGGGAVMWWGSDSRFYCSDCIFDSNEAIGHKGQGGAILLTSWGGNNVIERSLFINNKGISAGAVFDAGEGTSYINNTFYQNTGDAVFLNYPGSRYLMVNNTFVNNTTTFGAGAINTSADVGVHMANNLIYANSGPFGNCKIGKVLSYGSNLIYPQSPHCGMDSQLDFSFEPQLRPLADNGGFSASLLLDSNSPARKKGQMKYCPNNDQRGFSRSQRSCDIGAVQTEADD